MAKNSVLSRPHVSQSQGRHAFDRSFIRNYTQSAGMITPVMFEPCLAGTKGKINRKVFTRSAQVLAPAFPAVKMNFDFFKIPIRFLWSKWNDFKLNINDLNSSALTTLMTSGAGNPAIDGVVPRFDFKQEVAENLTRLINTYQSAMTATQKALYLNDAMRLLEPLYGLQGGALIGGSSTLNANVKSLFALAAYQKVYYDHYRNTAYEQNNPYAYNLDWLQNMATPNLFEPTSLQEFLALRHMLTLRYVNYRNDYYKNIYPSLNYTSAVPQGLDWNVPSSLSGGYGASPSANSADGGRVFVGGSVYVTSLNNSTYQSVMSVQNIRAAFALDKLLRASAYTPKHVKDQIKARFGVDVGDKVSYESQRLGSFDNDIIFGEVTNSSKTAYADLGAVGGKGIGASNFEKDIDFYCEEDSIILGVSYILPRAIYDCQPDEWSDRLIREDFYQPEFENLGLRPLYGRPGQPNYITGYTVPHQRLKLGRDFNMGEFKETAEHYANDGAGNLVQQSYTGVLSSYTIHSQFDYTGSGSAGVPVAYFKCKPSDLDAIFAYSYPTDGHQQDHFFSHLEIKFNVVSSMSYHGQPFM